VVRDLVDEHLARLAVLDALDDVADAGLAGVAGGQGLGVGQEGLDHLQRHHLLAGAQGHRQVRQEAEGAQDGEDIDVVVAEAHPEADAVGVDVLRERVQLVVAVEVHRAHPRHREVVDALHRVRRVLLPLPVDPGPDLDELAEVDLGVEVGGEVLAVAAGIDVEDVDGVDGIEEVLRRQGAVGVDHAGVETDAEDGREALGLAAVLALPFVVGIPGRVLADLVRFLVNGRIHVHRAGLQAGLQDRHIHEGIAEVDDDLGAGLADQPRRRRDVQGVDLTRVEPAGRVLEVPKAVDAGDNLVTLRHRA